MPYKINPQAFIDYEKPIGKQYDFRTTNYISHHYMADVPMGESLHQTIDISKFRNKPRPSDNCQTEMKDSYVPKYIDPDITRNPSVKKPLHIKPYEQQRFQNAPKPINQFETVNHLTYQGEPERKVDYFPKMNFDSSVENSKIIIDPEKSGCYKYLDLMATTNMLNYPKWSHDNITGIGAKDNITLWNWFGMYQPHLGQHLERPINISSEREEMCAKYPSPLCPKRHCEFPSMVKHVPNGGLTTESRYNYKKPILKVVNNIDVSQQPVLFTSSVRTTDWKTESSIIGSGQPVQKYVSTTDFRVKNK